MKNKMLIDAGHPEETRVVVVRGERVEEFDYESATRKQLRGNIYLAKVTRIEPSLQAAFIEYGGNRHGFLAFSEIHPDYYQIPVADRQALLEAEAQEARARNAGADTADSTAEQPTEAEDGEAPEKADSKVTTTTADDIADDSEKTGGEDAASDDSDEGDPEATEDPVESVGAEDALEEVPERRRYRARQYKIQEVLRRRQVLLVQVVKEERGNKGAALTTYLSLAGRYSVLMPNTARGGGISRKITSPSDRKRLKEVASDLDVPEGMGVILRTAGASRTKAEVKRDFEYLLRLWESVRELTLQSTAPSLVYEEGSLIKRSIRDLYSRDVGEILVTGEDGYREAKDFMRMLMPSHAKNVQPYRESQPIFAHYGVEAQLDAMFSPQVSLPAGGYIVINQTEALVSIDVNSGRSTREHSIEDTALQTNLQASEEVSRQLRLRDLAGLVVIDFIDMEERRNNRAVEKRLKDCLKDDRARIQVGRISHFGLLEMSRQRIRTGVLESTSEVCPHCMGTGHVRSAASVALHVLRSLEDHLLKGVTRNLDVRTRTKVALYILNQKRTHLSDLERLFDLNINIVADESITTPAHFLLEQGDLVGAHPVQPISIQPTSVAPEYESLAADEETDEGDHGEQTTEGQERKKKRRRRRKRSDASAPAEQAATALPETNTETDNAEPGTESDQEAAAEPSADGSPKRRRRGRRGGRRARRGNGAKTVSTNGADAAPGGGEQSDTISRAYEIAEKLSEVAPGASHARTIDDAELGPAGAAETTIDTAASADLDEGTETSEAAEGAATPEPKDVAADDDQQPPPKEERRGGWWQRRGFF